MSSNLLNTLHAPSIRVREHSENGWWVVLWELEWKHAQSHSSWEHGGQYAFKGLSENSIRTSGRWPWKHSGERFRSSNDVNTRPINRGKREREWTSIEKKTKKMTSVPGCRTTKLFIFLAPGRGAGFHSTRSPPPPLCFFLFSLFTIRVVYNSFACSHRIFGSPSLAVLYWIGKDGRFFQSLRALKCMQAGIQSP